jgi:hypothetical protein
MTSVELIADDHGLIEVSDAAIIAEMVVLEEIPTCIHCGEWLPPGRYMYCNDDHSAASRAAERSRRQSETNAPQEVENERQLRDEAC